MEQGILYVATGRSYIDEAAASVQSVRTNMPGVPVTVFTDEPAYARSRLAADHCRALSPSESNADAAVAAKTARMNVLSDPPYEKTLLLDTDTYVCASCEDVFPLLDRFPLALAHDPIRSRRSFERETLVDAACPDVFPEFNTGVMAFKKGEATRAFFKEWQRIYEQEQLAGAGHFALEQPAFRKALYASDLPFYVLPPEYNCRTTLAGMVGGGARAKIIHGRQPDLKQVGDLLNETTFVRVFLPDTGWVNGGTLKVLSGSDAALLPSKIINRLTEQWEHLVKHLQRDTRVHSESA